MAKKKKRSDKHKLRDFFQERLTEKRTAEPACRHFGVCGGCEFQDVPYGEQLLAKQDAFGFILDEVLAERRTLEEASDDPDQARELAARTEGLVAAFAGQQPPIVASPRPYGYRQRMDYVNAFGKAGLRRANRHRQVVELEECPLLGETGFAVFRKARALADAAGIADYDYLRHTGQLRYIVVRRNRDDHILLSVVTKNRDDREAVMGVLQSLVDAGDIDSGHWLLAEGMGDTSFGTPTEAVGQPWIVETMNGIGLRIGPNTFFQSNPAVAEQAYAAIRAFCPPGGSVLDMYSGVGSIAASVASGAGTVTAVENVPENVALAEINIRENGLDNVTLRVDDSAAWLAAATGQAGEAQPDLLIVNPPRPGVENGGMEAIRRLGPERIAYLSCNPFTLLRNLAQILDNYEVSSLTLYDMFPQTRHFESLALLKRRPAPAQANPE